MKFQGITGNFAEAGVDALAVAMFKGEKIAARELKELDKLTSGLLTNLIKAEEFKGEPGETALIRFLPRGAVKASRLLLVGVGDKADYKMHVVASLAGTATRFLRKRNLKSFALLPRAEGSASDIVQNAVQGAITSQIEQDKNKTKNKKDGTNKTHEITRKMSINLVLFRVVSWFHLFY